MTILPKETFKLVHFISLITTPTHSSCQLMMYMNCWQKMSDVNCQLSLTKHVVIRVEQQWLLSRMFTLPPSGTTLGATSRFVFINHTAIRDHRGTIFFDWRVVHHNTDMATNNFATCTYTIESTYCFKKLFNSYLISASTPFGAIHGK